MTVSAVLGIVLIAGTTPFLFGAEAGSKDFLIAWSESFEGSAQAPVGAAGSTTTVPVMVTDAQPAKATIQASACNDGATAPLQEPATISWGLFEGDATEAIPGGTGTLSCTSLGPIVVDLTPHADIGEVASANAADARAEAYEAGVNRTVEYQLRFTWSRPAAPGGLPLPPPAFTATVSIEVTSWTATANEGEEVVR